MCLRRRPDGCVDVVKPDDPGSLTGHAFGAFSVYAPCVLPNLPPAAKGRPTSRIDLDWADASPPEGTVWAHHWVDGEDVLLSLARQQDDYWLRVPGYADFLVQLQPCTVRVSPGPRALDASTLEHLLVDQILPRVLAQLGASLVHASTVCIGQRHVLFLGPSGWGKSTLAGLLHQRGHQVLSDDCVQLMAEPGGRFRAIPTYPSLRLNADSLEAVLPGQIDTAPVASYSNKRRVPIAPLPEAGPPTVVDAIYVLGDPAEAGDDVRITPASPASACLALIKHSFRLDLADRAATVRQLEQCSRIARSTPAFLLDYPRDHARNASLLDALLTHIHSLPPPHEPPGPP